MNDMPIFFKVKIIIIEWKLTGAPLDIILPTLLTRMFFCASYILSVCILKYYNFFYVYLHGRACLLPKGLEMVDKGYIFILMCPL